MNLLINLLIFSLPLGVILRITPIPNVSIYPFDFIAGLIFLYVLFEIVSRKTKIRESKLFILISLFLLTGFISLIINAKYLTLQTFLTSFAYSLRFAAYACIIFAFQFLDQKFKDSLNIKLIAAGMVFTFIGFIQYFYYPNLRNLYYLGWDEHLYRLFSTFLDPNFAGAFLVLLLILVSENIISSFSKNKTRTAIFIFLWVLSLIAIILTYSRSAFIMLIIGITVLLLVHRMFKILPFLIFLFLALLFIFSNRNIEGLNPLRIASVEARVESTEVALSIISKNPILGVGFNAYRYAQIRYGVREERGALASHADAGTDNSYLFVLATTGILGFLIFLDLWVNIIKIIVRNLKSGTYARVALASIAGLLVNTVFINSLFYAPIIAWTFMLVGLTVSKKQ